MKGNSDTIKARVKATKEHILVEFIKGSKPVMYYKATNMKEAHRIIR